jgi:hypothetical protein
VRFCATRNIRSGLKGRPFFLTETLATLQYRDIFNFILSSTNKSFAMRYLNEQMAPINSPVQSDDEWKTLDRG